MRIVIQRVLSGKITVNSEVISAINMGLAVFVGIEKGDTEKDVLELARKISNIRIFEDEAGKMMFKLPDSGEILLIPQFTLIGNLKGMLRPDFNDAMEPSKAKELFCKLLNVLREEYSRIVKEGAFGEHMIVDLKIDGPVTIIYDTRSKK
ncbi:MAG: D-aminoacyl-tRNA deacylase [Caldisericia bacterium]|nr:D-tyrosyl-tRNA(Tyr) deacylase [Candidatus Cloacimonas sp.]MDD5689056.1 D-aminoacyl-tRNA deacylase [Caldisericia bacterium]